jgi:catechol 2,3-dioxygenase-like lactoylglutathione lyase family enzyme
MTAPDQYASVRYLVDDVQAAIDFYTTHPPLHAEHQWRTRVRGRLARTTAAAAVRPRKLRRTGHPADAATAGQNRIHLVAGDLDAEITRLCDAGLAFRGDVIAGPGGRQILLADPAGNPVELFQPAHRPASPEEAS